MLSKTPKALCTLGVCLWICSDELCDPPALRSKWHIHQQVSLLESTISWEAVRDGFLNHFSTSAACCTAAWVPSFSGRQAGGERHCTFPWSEAGTDSTQSTHPSNKVATTLWGAALACCLFVEAFYQHISDICFCLSAQASVQLAHSGCDSVPWCPWDRPRGASQHTRIQLCCPKGERAEQVSGLLQLQEGKGSSETCQEPYLGTG